MKFKVGQKVCLVSTDSANPEVIGTVHACGKNWVKVTWKTNEQWWAYPINRIKAYCNYNPNDLFKEIL